MKYVFLLLFLSFSVEATQLDEAIHYGLKNNLRVKAAEYKFLAEKEQFNQAFSPFLPTISASLSHDLKQNDLSPLSKGITISQKVFTFGGDIAAYNKAEKLVIASETNFLQTKQKIVLDIINAYTAILEKDEVNKLYEHSVKTIEKHLEAAKQRFELGETTKIYLEKSKHRLSSAISEKIRAEGNLSNAYAHYIHVIGMNPESISEPNSLPKTPLSLPQAIELAFSNNLQIKLSSLVYKSAQDELTEANARFLPSISLSLNLSANSAMLTTSIPLFQGGTGYLKMRQAKYSLKQNEENYYETEKDIKEQITVAWNNLITSRSVVESSKKEVESLVIVLESEEEAKKLSLSTLLDVIDAENDLLTAKVSLLTAKIKYILDLYNLLLLTNDIKDLFK